jgi:hypothetical protein
MLTGILNHAIVGRIAGMRFTFTKTQICGFSLVIAKVHDDIYFNIFVFSAMALATILD